MKVSTNFRQKINQNYQAFHNMRIFCVYSLETLVVVQSYHVNYSSYLSTPFSGGTIYRTVKLKKTVNSLNENNTRNVSITGASGTPRTVSNQTNIAR